MVRIWMLVLLMWPAAASGMDSTWDKAVADYEAALSRARTEKDAKRIKSPWAKHAKRLRKAALVRGSAPSAARVLVAIARFTPDVDERVQAMVRLRENHMRSKHIAALIPSLVRWGDRQSTRTLRDIIRHSSHKDVVARAQLAQHELKTLSVGKTIPRTLGRNLEGDVIDAQKFRGRPFWVIVGPDQQANRRSFDALSRALKKVQRKDPRAHLVLFSPAGWGLAQPSFAGRRLDSEDALRRYNAQDRTRVFLFDKTGALAAKDPPVWEYGDLIAKHSEPRKTGS